MSRKRTVYSAEFKSKLVLEVLKNEKTLQEIASANNITPKNLQNWKKIFLDNAEIAMEPSKAVKDYKEDLLAAQEQNEMLTKIVGKMTVEKEWLEKKLKSLDSSDRKQLIEPKLNTLPLTQQCALLGLNRSNLYYKKRENKKKEEIKTQINHIFKDIPIYGAAKVHQQLLEGGFKVSLNTVASYRQQMGLKAVLAVKQVNTTIPIKEHKKYTYKLRDLDISHANQVWSTDITYIKTKEGMVYLAAIIDWHSKAVLAHKISNTMDSFLVMDVLDEALSLYGTPEIFNTDQGSQYTSEIHTQRLKNKGITISMDGKGRATDNICIERFWRSAKCERIYLNEYGSIRALIEDVDDYIEFYNHQRFHESLDYKKPMNVYRESILANEQQNEAA
ncbi:transposase, IS3 family [Bathymodiolus japonicus methanotrophic gill symbiont]|nr:IS3 family transposase [Bathymodiolus japonicus methanotrophic gill symbiont]GFO73382.1 transposase, IS3 family [Bathymodiolus japonicus methanotrophic gill symbiont]